ncbi:hypothetical protein [Caballeronia pedi]|uniref:hypothetical protein n=1 Tax=Caballeronia pedi TaxID=1777141 RepID=UPI000772AAAF|nr:hypothetical protein [Caballeronia pedi]
MKAIVVSLSATCLLASTVVLTACSIDPVSKESDLAYTDEVVAGTPEKVMRSLQDRQRRCGSFLGALTVNGTYMPDAPDQILEIQVHMSSLGPVGMGRVRMSPADDGTLVRVGVKARDAAGGARKKISALAADPSLPCDY